MMQDSKDKTGEAIEGAGFKLPVWVFSEPRILAILVSVALLYAALFSNLTISGEQKVLFFVAGILIAIAALLITLRSSERQSRIDSEAKSAYEEKEQASIQSHEIASITTSQESLHDIIQSKFIDIPDHGKIFQTYIGAFPIAGQRDLIDKIPDEKICEIERIFGVTSPYEINFAYASNDKTEFLRSERNGKIKLKNELIALNISDIEFGFVTNITIFTDLVIVTYKTNRESNYTGDSEVALRFPPLFADSSTTMALVLSGEQLSERFNSCFRHRFSMNGNSNIEEIKKNFYQKNRLEYFAAIAYSIAKEIAFIEELNPYDKKNKGKRKLGYIGIVGSLAQALISNTDSSAKDINDIDLLVFVDNDSLDVLNIIYEKASDVARRYSIPSLFNISIDNDIAPRFSHPESNINVQLLINDFSIIKGKSFVGAIEPSKFTMATRLHCNFRLSGELRDYYIDDSISYHDLLNDDDPYSVVQLINAVNSRKIGRRYWDHDLKIMKEKMRTLDESELSRFYQYCLKWGLINFYFASSNKEQRDGVEFRNMMDNALEIAKIRDFDLKNNIQKDDCLRILKTLKELAVNELPIIQT